AVIKAQQVDPIPQNNAYWVKIVQTTLPQNVGLNDLIGGHNPYENLGVAALNDKPETEVEWQVLQPGRVDEVSKSLDLKGNPSAVVRYQFYKYLGTFDGEGLVDPSVAETPTGNTLTASVGTYVGEQIAGFNAVGAVPEPTSWLLSTIGLLTVQLIRRRAKPRVNQIL
ncbi:MAG: hypothetical protein KGI91_14730, partial [Burkholderiales bacterium]|nr:hypothetical protein [Burkholderiales bacterium]